eukprot:TRINITY_DN24462_c0_g2_i2.p1 TRINITY_DN24462_c0_g2~~TRINITY_DN24462_c0_g2_i2.p1  ORF type:complete len:460 (+),score=109.29 TRINITY_DN24462_c0_g2_i2:147-1526(+)
MERLSVLTNHLAANQLQPQPARDEKPPAISPPVVHSTKQFATDPTRFLLQAKADHPDMFLLQKSTRESYVVLTDPTLFEDVLSDETLFGNPITPNMSVNRLVFGIPASKLDEHENNAVKQLRRLMIHHDQQLASVIADRLQQYMDAHLSEEGECDLRDLGTAVFWPMTQALFGDEATLDKAPKLLKAFEDIDSNFGAALRGKQITAVKEGVQECNRVFGKMVDSASPSCPLAPIPQFYSDLTGGDAELVTKFSTSAWWGGQGNTLPATIWTFGLLLADPKFKQAAYDEVDAAFSGSPDSNGIYDFGNLEFLTACLKETLRLKTYSIAWRSVQRDTVLEAGSGKRYTLVKGQLVSVVWSLQHLDPANFVDPSAFRPTRWLPKGQEENAGKPMSWAPFSHGIHKCSGFPLAMLEIPLVLALFLKKFDMELLDPLPGMDFKSAFGVVGPDEQPVRVRYKRRA